MGREPAVVRPSWKWFAVLDGGMVSLAVLASNEGAHRAVSGLLPVALPPRRALRTLFAAAVVVHVAEAAAAARGARRRGLPVAGWAGQTLLVGFPSLLALRRLPAA
jgi:transmembrane protein TMEM254